MFDHQHADAWVSRLSALNRRIHFLFSGIGEPVLLEGFRSFVHDLYDRQWVSSILIFTNGSRIDLVEEFAACNDKIHFHASYHPTQIQEHLFIDNIIKINDMNLLSRISTVAYKYTPIEMFLRKILNYSLKAHKNFEYKKYRFSHEKISAFMDRLGPLQSKLTIQGIDAIIPPFSPNEKDLIMRTRLSGEKPFLFREKSSAPRGVTCNCGKNLIICDHQGNFWRCSQYINSMKRLSISEGSYGNLFTNPRLDAEATPCHQKKCSIARQEFAMRNDTNLYVDIFSTIRSQENQHDTINK